MTATTRSSVLPDGYELVDLGVGDLTRVVNLVSEVCAATWVNHPHHVAKTTERERLARILGDRICIGVERCGELVAFSSLDVSEPVALLGTLFVRERGQGIGRALVEHRLELARHAGASAAKAYVNSWNEVSVSNLVRADFELVDAVADGWDPDGGTLYVLARPLP